MADFEESSRKQIAAIVNNILRDTSNEHSARINENFEFVLVDANNNPVEASTGKRLLFDLAFVSALVKLARERSRADSGFFITGTIAPFVIDAPLGALDESYREIVCRFLIEHSDQLILLLSKSHWTSEVDAVLRPTIGREASLVIMDTSLPSGALQKTITVNGKQYPTRRFEQPIPSTTIEAIA